MVLIVKLYLIKKRLPILPSQLIGRLTNLQYFLQSHPISLNLLHIFAATKVHDTWCSHSHNIHQKYDNYSKNILKSSPESTKTFMHFLLYFIHKNSSDLTMEWQRSFFKTYYIQFSSFNHTSIVISSSLPPLKDSSILCLTTLCLHLSS